MTSLEMSGIINCLRSLSTDSNVSLARKLGAEFVGTFILVFSATGGPILNEKYNGVETLMGNAACAGLAVMVVVFSIGHISGAHINPAVTIAFAALRHFPWAHVPGYITVQVLGSISASFALKAVFHPFMSGGVTVPSPGVSHAQVFMLEFILTFFLMFIITAVATDTCAVGELAGIAIGATILLDVLLAGPTTGASMNPVRTIGPAIARGNYRGIWMYMVAPPLGAIVGAATYTAVKLHDKPPIQCSSLFVFLFSVFVVSSNKSKALAQESRDAQLRLADELKVAQQEIASRDIALRNMSKLEATLTMTMKEVENKNSELKALREQNTKFEEEKVATFDIFEGEKARLLEEFKAKKDHAVDMVMYRIWVNNLPRHLGGQVHR
ncbi:probable aquaporin NIP5-1 [Humulus lupulus]|uniref:probable aquaporin NIP5-1 n=1 Tax=Humulus lupulus TaxID=3486 RepID=UPI002B414E1E|nr:probable aquaporin NIP5-1 [Humulus lupulus]